MDLLKKEQTTRKAEAARLAQEERMAARRGDLFSGNKPDKAAKREEQDVIDEAVLGTHDGRLLHSFACNNLGAAAQDEGRLEQALQHLGSAVAAVREEIEGAAAGEIVRLAMGEPLANRVN